jgi:hypothetical protein
MFTNIDMWSHGRLSVSEFYNKKHGDGGEDVPSSPKFQRT